MGNSAEIWFLLSEGRLIILDRKELNILKVIINQFLAT